MMLKVNGEYLDFDGDIEVDRQVKLFESIDEAAGDFSYSFSIPWTAKNIMALGFPLPDNRDKTVYETNDAEIIGDDGITIFRGSLRPEILVPNIEIQCSFFSGNSNWFSLLTGDMTSLRLSQYDVEQTTSNIRDSWEATSGIVWPILDAGGMSTRSYVDFKIEDFIPCFYAKTLMFEVFQQSGLKIAGELLDDWTYNNLILASNGRSQDDINRRSSYVLKTSTQSLPNVPPGPSVRLTFEDDINYPYFDGAQNNYDTTLDRYTADVKMRVKINLTLNFTSPLGVSQAFVSVRKNGINFILYTVEFNSTGSLQKTVFMDMDAADYSDIFISTDSLDDVSITGGAIKITPTYLYYAAGSSTAPKWTKQEFVNNILSMFNVITAYDPYSKTVTLNLFEKLKTKEPIDISEYVNIVEEDYAEFISDYGKSNKFSYQETDIDNLNDYNISRFVKYGVGVIAAQNDFIQESVDVLESDFASPISYVNGVFDMSMERIQFVEFDTEEAEITSVSAPGFGIARFNVSEDIFETNDLVRISESTNEAYNGDWVVQTTGAGYIQCVGPVYDTNATAKIEKLLHAFTTEDNVYLFINIPDYSLSKVKPGSLFFLDQGGFFSASIAYFNLLNTNNQINADFKQGLSFGEIEDPLFYQRTILQTYWPTFGRILNDPVKIRSEANLPWKIHNDIDFLRPLMIRTLETTNLYYLNLERGYKTSHIPCDLELIKLP
jgi:hypothetical protein